MGELLKIGQDIYLKDGRSKLKVVQFLGGGGQGEVYRVNINGKDLALKWYFPNSATETQRKILEKLIEVESPSEKFLWPMDIVEDLEVNGFGYIMNLRESNYKGISDLMKRKIEPSFKAIVTAGFELSDSFLKLHSKGMCYRDISFGNVFFNPEKGSILICDNDNVSIDSDELESGVLGTPRFMAPEVVIGKSKPSTKTDLYSLATLLFYMFMMGHPLEGKKESKIKCFDLPAMNKLYGTDPVFIFHPEDSSNRPVPGYQDSPLESWPTYPKFLQKMFEKSFTEGIKDPTNGRVRESEWRSSMIKLRDSIIYCTCGVESFYDLEEMKNGSGEKNKCWNCRKELVYPPRIKIGSHVIMLNYDTEIFDHHIAHHTEPEKMYNFEEAIAKVVQNPKNPSIWGIKNISSIDWIVDTRENKSLKVGPGKTVTISLGTKINFGKTEGEIRI